MNSPARIILVLGLLTGLPLSPLSAAEPPVRTGSTTHGPLGGFSGALVTRHAEHLLAPQSPTQAAQLARARTLRLLETALPRFDSSLDQTVPTKLLESKRSSDQKSLWIEGSRLPRDR
jgi:hypothetical protein